MSDSEPSAHPGLQVVVREEGEGEGEGEVVGKDEEMENTIVYYCQSLGVVEEVGYCMALGVFLEPVIRDGPSFTCQEGLSTHLFLAKLCNTSP